MSAVVDASRCPLCGTANRCAMELARETGSDAGECWCMQADFSLAPLAQVPAPARGLACLCARCAAGQPPMAREKNPLP